MQQTQVRVDSEGMTGKLPEPSPLSAPHRPNSQASGGAGVDHGDGGGGTATLPSRRNVATIRPERTGKTGGGCGRRTPPPRPLRAGPCKALHVTPLAAWGQQEPQHWREERPCRRSGLSAGPQLHCGRDFQPEDTLHGNRPVPREAEQGSSRQSGATEAAGAPAASEASPPAPVPTPHAMETQLKRHHAQGDRQPGPPNQVSTNRRPARALRAPWLLGDGQREATGVDGVDTQLSCLAGPPDAESEAGCGGPRGGGRHGCIRLRHDTLQSEEHHFRSSQDRDHFSKRT